MNVVTVDPEIMWGTPCFTGTRVPVQTVFDYFLDGHTIDEFHRDFPEVKKSQVSKVIQQASEVKFVICKSA